MKLNEYQDLARRTLTLDPDKFDRTMATCAMGLTGEAGEVVEHIKKWFGHGHDLERLKVRKELGDVLWYLAALATLCDMKLEDIAEGNIEKLKARYPLGFDKKRSQERRDEKVYWVVYHPSTCSYLTGGGGLTPNLDDALRFHTEAEAGRSAMESSVPCFLKKVSE